MSQTYWLLLASILTGLSDLPAAESLYWGVKVVSNLNTVGHLTSGLTAASSTWTQASLQRINDVETRGFGEVTHS